MYTNKKGYIIGLYIINKEKIELFMEIGQEKLITS